MELKRGFEMNKDVKVIALSAPRSSDRAINFVEGLALLFIGLKLTGKLEDWTWIEALSPLWLPVMINWFIYLVRSTILPMIWPEEDEDRK